MCIRDSHYTEYVEKIDEIVGLIARDTVYSGDFDAYLDANFPATGGKTSRLIHYFFLKSTNGVWLLATNCMHIKPVCPLRQANFSDEPMIRHCVQVSVNCR